MVRVSYDVGLVRFNPNGSLDRTFGVDGHVQDDILSYASGLVVQPNGRSS